MSYCSFSFLVSGYQLFVKKIKLIKQRFKNNRVHNFLSPRVTVGMDEYRYKKYDFVLNR